MDNLVKHLIASGIDEDQANKIAATLPDANAEIVADENIDVERLQKALNDISEAMAETNNEEADAAVAEAQSVAEAVTLGADKLLAEVRSQNEALAKGLLAIGEEMRAVKDFLANQVGSVAQVEERVEAVRKSLSAPLPAKAVGTAANPVESPYDNSEDTETPAFYISKALTELRGTADEARQATLRKAITQLECGVDLLNVKTNFNL